MVIFGVMAYHFYKTGNQLFCFISIIMALLFQPFFKLALGRALWNIIDVITAIALGYLWYKNSNLSFKEKT